MSIFGTQIRKKTYELTGSEVGSFTKISVSNCNENQARCILKRGTNATVAIEFTISK